jgi:hypothetical protein
MEVFVKKGDVIYANRGLYKHYGIYNSERSVIHFSPDKGKEISPENAYIRETSLAAFLKGDELHIDCSIHPAFPPDEIACRARSLVGKSRGEYDLFFYNCEHFARWCATGELESKQVKKGVAVAVTIAATATVALVVKAISDREDSPDGRA